MLRVVGLPFTAYSLWLGLCLPIGDAYALSWPLLTYPAGSVTEPMGQQLRHNGYRIQITRFTVNQPVEQVLQFFRSSWKSSTPNHATLDDWHILTKQEGHFVSTIEVRAELRNRTQGVAAVRFLQDVHTLDQGLPKDLPIGSGSRIASLLESEDSGRHAVTIVLIVAATPMFVHRFYQRELPLRGWSTREGLPASAGAGVHTLFISKANRSGMVQTTRAAGMTQSIIHIDHGY